MGVACIEFRGENFRGWRENREICESFLPRKFPTIRYFMHSTTNVRGHKKIGHGPHLVISAQNWSLSLLQSKHLTTADN